MSFKTTQQQGFALLLTLIVVSVVLSVGLSLLDITLKQLILSGTTRDSEISFHAAYVGTECAERWVREDYEEFTEAKRGAAPGPAFSMPDCVDSPLNGSYKRIGGSGSDRYESTYTLDWMVDGEGRCTEFDIVIYDALTHGSDMTDSLSTYGYNSPIKCDSGNVCTYIFSRGYNRACTEITSLGTVQREVFSKF